MIQARRVLTALTDTQQLLTELPQRFPDALAQTLADAANRITVKKAEIDSAEAKALVANRTGHDGYAFLEGYDSSEWLALVRAARAFSETYAYPGSPFPHTGAGARCPLCQQALDLDAATRLKQFAEALSSASTAVLADDNQVRLLRVELERLESDQAAELRRFDGAIAAVQQIAGAIRSESTSSETERMLQAVIAALDTLAVQARRGLYIKLDFSTLHRSAAAAGTQVTIDTETVSKTLAALENAAPLELDPRDAAQIKELEARKWLHDNLPAMLKRVELNRTINTLQTAGQELGVTPLTNLSKRIAKELVTTRLVEALLSQLDAVGLGHLKAQIVTSGQAGVTTIRLAPPDKSFKKTGMSDVLSEGEQSLMGIAAFFAELELAGHTGPIVLDDPVSGLDRQNRQVLADRLATEASQRQVLILTHDEEFADMLEQSARNRQSRFKRRIVSREDSRVGLVTPT